MSGKALADIAALAETRRDAIPPPEMCLRLAMPLLQGEALPVAKTQTEGRVWEQNSSRIMFAESTFYHQMHHY